MGRGGQAIFVAQQTYCRIRAAFDKFQQYFGLECRQTKVPIEERQHREPCSRTCNRRTPLPLGAHLTDYDRAHTATYLRLLDAAKEGAPWEEATQLVLGIDPLLEPARAKQASEFRISLERDG